MRNVKFRATGLVPSGQYESDYFRSMMNQTLFQRGLHKFNFKRYFDFYQVKKLISSRQITHLLVFDFDDLATTSYYRFMLLQYAILFRVCIIEIKSGITTLDEYWKVRADSNIYFSLNHLNDNKKVMAFAKRITAKALNSSAII